MQWLCRYPLALEDRRYLMSLCCHSTMSLRERDKIEIFILNVFIPPQGENPDKKIIFFLPIVKRLAWLVIPLSIQSQERVERQLLSTTNELLRPTSIDDSVLECECTMLELKRKQNLINFIINSLPNFHLFVLWWVVFYLHFHSFINLMCHYCVNEIDAHEIKNN